MKNNTIIKIYSKWAICTLLGLGILTSCTDGFEEINRPGDKLVKEDFAKDNFTMGAFFVSLQDISLPAQENKFQHNQNLLGDYVGRYMMYTNDRWSLANFTTYNAPASWVAEPFKNVMTEVYSPWREIAKTTNKTGVAYAWAQMLRVHAMQRLTDMYGPIPYSKVETSETKTPYDSQEEVYNNLFKDLDEAMSVISAYVASNPGATPFAEYDKVYGGDLSKWVKFANSLKLRMAIRIRYANPALAKQKAEEAVSAGVITSNADNAKEQYAKNPLEVMWNTYGDARLSADMDTFLNGYGDPRSKAYAQTSKITGSTRDVVGIRTGANITNQEVARRYSAPVVATTDPILWISAAEVAFCKAEGAMLSWNMGGSVKDLYEEGVKLSFEQWGVSGADTYLQDSTKKQANYEDLGNVGGNTSAVSTITIKWDDNSTEEEKLERLITQKWIALWPNGQEAWSEIRRTGYPKVLPLAQNTTYGNLHVPNRIPFSPTEYTNNPTNVRDAVSALGGTDDYATKLWWQKK